MAFLDKLKNIVRWSRVTGGADNSLQFPAQQISFKGKTADAITVFPYGLYANISITDSLALLFAVEGSEDNRAIIGYTPKRRPTDLNNQEIALYHPFSNAFIKFRNTGDIEITSPTKITVDSPLVEFTGNVTIAGNLTVEGTTILGENVTSDGTDISNTHTHPQGNDSDGDTEQDTGPPQ